MRPGQCNNELSSQVKGGRACAGRRTMHFLILHGTAMSAGVAREPLPSEGPDAGRAEPAC